MMSKFEVTTDSKHPFLSKVKFLLKPVSVKGSSELKRQFNLNKKWEIEKKLFDNIENSTESSTENKELRCILHRIVSQMSTVEADQSCKTANSLIGILVDRISSFLLQAQTKEQSSEHREQYMLLSSESILNLDEFSCQCCCELLYNPVTLPCGHTFCQTCLLQNSMDECIICSKALKSDLLKNSKINIILTKVLQKWHSLEWFARSLVADGLQKFNDEQYQESVLIFTQALDITPNSHIATLHRAKAYYLLNNLDQALKDSVRASLLTQKWSEVYYVKGEILFKLHCFEQSLLSLLICFVLDPKNSCAKERMQEIIMKLVGSVYDDSSPRSIQSKDDEQIYGQLATLTSHKRSYMGSNSSLSSKSKTAKKDSDFYATCGSIISLDQLETSSSSSGSGSLDGSPASPLSKSDTELDKIAQSEKSQGTMAKSNTHVVVTFELAYDKTRHKMLIGDGLGSFPSMASELEKSLDTALYEVDGSVTGDLRMLQNSAYNKEILEMVNLKLPTKPRVFDSKLVDASEFECILCMRLFYDPVCTPCGHMFCQLCIERSLDHNPQCPLCKHCMKEYLADHVGKHRPTCNYTTKSLIETHLPESHKERQQQHKDEMKELLEMQPIFVCTIAFPSVTCPLHIFEPRYRLMLRRCLDHNEQEFGMCMPDKDKGHLPIGTMLKVRNVTFFSDGRSVVESIGSRRFMTCNSQVKDGYHVAKISYIVDRAPVNRNAVENLSGRVYEEGKMWFHKLDSTVKTRIIDHFGKFPNRDDKPDGEDGPDWVWWILAILPVEDRVKAAVLGKDKLQERLLIIHRIFTCLQLRDGGRQRSVR